MVWWINHPDLQILYFFCATFNTLCELSFSLHLYKSPHRALQWEVGRTRNDVVANFYHAVIQNPSEMCHSAVFLLAVHNCFCIMDQFLSVLLVEAKKVLAFPCEQIMIFKRIWPCLWTPQGHGLSGLSGLGFQLQFSFATNLSETRLGEKKF